MSNLTAGFAAWISKHDASSQGEANPRFEVPGEKR